MKEVLKKINKLNKYKGINLKFNGEINLEDPCWSGWEQYGMKEKDGKLVPNCIKKQ